MKLRNKKTGEIVDMNVKTIEYPVFPQCYPKHKLYNSLAELNEVWEDYEEPKYLYIIDPTRINFINVVYKDDEPDWCEQALELGIGFKTKEEAERAVEKLKAWKRLKACGFKFSYWDRTSRAGDAELSMLASVKEYMGFTEDLDLLVGGEE